MDKAELEELREQIETLQDAFYNVKNAVKQLYPRLYEQWKNEGFIIDENIVCHTNLATIDGTVSNDLEEVCAKCDCFPCECEEGSEETSD